MAKISPVSIKYIIHASFMAEGRLEKPDVIGAIFGQTEGLLGSSLEMRELQKEGKIGRIDVDIEYADGKTNGKIHIPSALDKAETTILAAAVETIERIGPTDSKIKIENVEDVRGNKRDYIIKRAKELLEQVQGSVPESRDMADTIKEGAKLAKLQEYGDEKLPCGDISGEELIVVEGRADVLALLKNNVTNVIAMNGTKLPEGVKELSKSKEVTLFVDGDRGGKLIVKNVVENAKVDYVAFAPDGKEVEELTGKEILQSLRKREKVEAVMSGLDESSGSRRPSYREERSYHRSGFRDRGERGDERRSYGRSDSRDERRSYRNDSRNQNTSEEVSKKRDLTEDDFKKINKLSEEISGKKSAYLLNDKMEIINECPLSGISSKLMRTREPVFAIIVDGKVNSGIVASAERRGVHHIIARNFAQIDTKLNLVSI